MTDCSMDGTDEISDPIETRITLEKVTVNVGILFPPVSDPAYGIIV